MKNNISDQLFMTISARQLISDYHIKKDPAGHSYIHYSFSYNNQRQRRYYISSIDSIDDNALLYQLSLVYNPEASYREDSVNTALIFVDFEDIFENMGADISSHAPGTLAREDLSPYSQKINNDFRMQVLFRDGLQIVYKDKTITYIPFEKSNSMARNNKMSFIASELYEEINPRLELDIPFKNNQLTLSKFFSYKGLYLSSGSRVICDKLLLNEETVIVIKDIVVSVEDQLSLSAHFEKDTQKWLVDKPKKGAMRIDQAFDGEGIISPEYASHINEALYPNQEGATSFQIRMPFAKGMLHQVDFHAFLAEFATPTKDGALLIKDAFGQMRDLTKAHIIMSASMLKCISWLTDYIDKDEANDPMKYYFDRFHKYQHALYITNTNRGFKATGYTPLTYQFLNTLQLSRAQMDEIANIHMEKINNPRAYVLDTTKFDANTPTWLTLLSKDEVFEHDKVIKDKLKSMQDSLRKDIANGRFMVEGEIRFLSRDLLMYLTRLLRLLDACSESNTHESVIRSLEVQGLYEDRFYMPNSNIDLTTSTHCAIFRSPHLSRNEQCALRPLGGTEDSIYCRYFSHLTGVIMMAFKSLDPKALGGADFDGDEVKIISNKHIVDAVLNGSYKKVKKRKYQRKLPIIDIPSPPGKTGKYDRQSVFYYSTLKNTFSNKVGQISNMAIRLGQSEYSSCNDSTDYDWGHSCAACTIFTGLEIDAAKTGVHPDLKELISFCKNLKLDYEYIQDLNQPLSEADVHSSFKPTKLPKLPENDNDYVHPLKLLAHYYMQSNTPSDNSGKGNRYIYFSFMKDKNWKKTIDAKAQEEINAIISAYSHVLEIARKVNRYVSRYEDVNFAGHIRTLLNLQYDPNTSNYIFQNEFPAIFARTEELFSTKKDVEDAIKRLKDSHWPFLLPNQREEALRDIFQIDANDRFIHYFPYLCNFNSLGYYLAFYLLQDILALKVETASTEENAEYYKQKMEGVDSDLYHKAFDKFYNFYLKETSYCKSDTIWKKELFEESSKMIDDIFKQSEEAHQNDNPVKTMFAIKNRKYFWDYFAADDLIDYCLPKEEEPQC